MLPLEEMLERLDDARVGRLLEAHAIGQDVTHVGIRDEHLAQRAHALIGREQALRLGAAPLAAQDDADAAAQDARVPAPTRAEAAA